MLSSVAGAERTKETAPSTAMTQIADLKSEPNTAKAAFAELSPSLLLELVIAEMNAHRELFVSHFSISRAHRPSTHRIIADAGAEEAKRNRPYTLMTAIFLRTEKSRATTSLSPGFGLLSNVHRPAGAGEGT